jgi:hypothetical protein
LDQKYGIASVYWQFNREYGAFSFFTFHFDAAAIGFNKLFTYRQPQALPLRAQKKLTEALFEQAHHNNKNEVAIYRKIK